MNMPRLTGAAVIAAMALLAGAARAQEAAPSAKPYVAPQPFKVAALCTIYDTWSHADVIVSKFLVGIPTDDGLLKPKIKIASLYLEQSKPDDLGHKLAARYNVPIYPTLESALTLGGEKLAVDGILLIAEHGKFPFNQVGQEMYPRMLWMARVVRVFEASGRVVPVWYDKHLAYDWLDAKWVYDRSRQMGIPMMAGSVIPVIWRDPADFEHPIGTPIQEAVVLAHGMVDRYAIHALEMLQCLTERRKGGETGIAEIECVAGEGFVRALHAGRFPMDMIEQALRERAGIDVKQKPLDVKPEKHAAIFVRYVDGTRATVLLLNGYYSQRWFYAARVGGKVQTCEFVYLRPPDYMLFQPNPAFSYLDLNIQEMFLTGKPQTPLERTLLATGAAITAIESERAGKPLLTPHLAISYKPLDFEPIRPKAPAPTGASIAPWPPQ